MKDLDLEHGKVTTIVSLPLTEELQVELIKEALSKNYWEAFTSEIPLNLSETEIDELDGVDIDIMADQCEIDLYQDKDLSTISIFGEAIVSQVEIDNPLGIKFQKVYTIKGTFAFAIKQNENESFKYDITTMLDSMSIINCEIKNIDNEEEEERYEDFYEADDDSSTDDDETSEEK